MVLRPVYLISDRRDNQLSIQIKLGPNLPGLKISYHCVKSDREEQPGQEYNSASDASSPLSLVDLVYHLITTLKPELSDS